MRSTSTNRPLRTAGGAKAAPKVGPILTYEGMSEPSGAVGWPANGSIDSFLVASDEDNVLRLYDAKGGEPVSWLEISPFFGLRPKHGMDIEGATWLNGRMYFIASQGRGKDGGGRPERMQFFALAAPHSPKGSKVPAPSFCSSALLDALAAHDPDLEKAIGDRRETEPSLTPEGEGINLEGMTGAADGTSLLLGFRNPLVEGRALVVPFENPIEVLEEDASPRFGKIMRLDLGGRGIRSIDYSAAAGIYYIVAGPSNGSGRFDLFTWEGGRRRPVPVPGADAALERLKDFHPEALVVDAAGYSLLLLSDDGNLRQGKKKRFRGVVFDLGAPG